MSLPLTRLAALIPLYRAPEPLAEKQRIASAVAGASLVFSGIKRGGVFGVVMAVAGADLVYRGIVGQGHICALVRAPSAKLLPEAVADDAVA